MRPQALERHDDRKRRPAVPHAARLRDLEKILNPVGGSDVEAHEDGELRIERPREVRRSKDQRWRSATGDVQANGSGADSVRATVVGPAEPDE